MLRYFVHYKVAMLKLLYTVLILFQFHKLRRSGTSRGELVWQNCFVWYEYCQFLDILQEKINLRASIRFQS